MNPYLKKPIDFAPLVAERLIGLIPEDQIDVALSPGRFTVREVVAHWADWEPILRGRIEQVRDEPGSTTVSYDEDQMAIDHDYASQDLATSLATWKAERAKTAVVVRALTDEDMSKQYVNADRGPETLADLAHMIVGHDMYHIEQLSEYLAK
jgi:hypothetical protein